MNKELMRHAMIDYARECCRREDNRYTPEQWVSVMNSYARHHDVELCAEKAEITPLEAALLYCRYSIVLSEKALSTSRQSHSYVC
jgi:hypothetical protein